MTTQARLHRPVERQRLEELAALGIDDSLKLDLIARLLSEPERATPLNELAAQSGKSLGAVRHALQELETAELVRCERFYNRETCRLAASAPVLLRLTRLLGHTPSERRRLRFALLSSRR